MYLYLFLMKASDLRIGDYVKVKPSGMIIQVAAVHNKKVAYHTVINKLSWVKECLLEPIRLSAMEKTLWLNGFHKNIKHNDARYEDSVLGEFIVLADNYTNATVVNRHTKSQGDDYNGNVEYLHELQHIMSDCKLTKKIKYDRKSGNN